MELAHHGYVPLPGTEAGVGGGRRIYGVASDCEERLQAALIAAEY